MTCAREAVFRLLRHAGVRDPATRCFWIRVPRNTGKSAGGFFKSAGRSGEVNDWMIPISRLTWHRLVWLLATLVREGQAEFKRGDHHPARQSRTYTLGCGQTISIYNHDWGYRWLTFSGVVRKKDRMLVAVISPEVEDLIQRSAVDTRGDRYEVEGLPRG